VIGFSKASLANGEKMRKQPTLIPELQNIKVLAAGGNHVQALDSKGNVFSWGSSSQGQLGRYVMDNYRTQALTPSQFGLPKTKIKYIACGSYHSFAIDKNDNVYAWGLSNFGQTGITTGAGEENSLILKPKIVEALQNKIIADIQGGSHHSIACTEDGELLVWGRCDDSQAGISLDTLDQDNLIFDGRNQPRILITPTIVPGKYCQPIPVQSFLLTHIDIDAIGVAAGIDDSFAITTDGTAFSWGFSSNFRTGHGTDDSIKKATIIENSAVRGKKLTFAGCGGQFSVLAGPATAKR
jgi:regulator of chromosome condensation